MSPVVHGVIALSINTNTKKYKNDAVEAPDQLRSENLCGEKNHRQSYIVKLCHLIDKISGSSIIDKVILIDDHAMDKVIVIYDM